MPLYEYEHVGPTPEGCEPRFEHLAVSSEVVLERCPVCHQPVRRVPARFAARKDVLAPSRVKDHGFTRLYRRDKGVYEEE